MSYEYKVVPAPTRGLKAKGIKTAEDRFANALETTMNDLAADGWDYIRADTLPAEQREGFMSKSTVYQNMLVFRRLRPSKSERIAPELAASLQENLPAPTPAPAPPPAPKVATDAPKAPPKPLQAPERDGPSSDVAAE